jgi:hypothetical protein
MPNARHVAGGVTDAVAARLAESGLLAVQGPTALDTRTGVLAGPGSTGLVTGTSSTGPMTYAIGVHVAVTSRGSANGVYLGPTLAAPTTVPTGAAPASGSRFDVIYAKQQDPTSGVPSPDAASGPLYGVLQGTASSSPTKPNIATIVGAVELATAQVYAGATSTNGANVTITPTAQQVVARGAPIPVSSQAERDALTQYPSLTVRRMDLPGLPTEVSGGGSWWRSGGDTGWVNTPGVGGTFTIGSGGSVYRVKNGWCSVRSHIGFTATQAIPDNQPIFTLPAEAWPSYVLDMPATFVYGGTGNGMVLETVLGTSGLLTVNGRTLTGAGLQIYLSYPVG